MLRKPTEMRRSTLTAVPTVIIGPEEGVDPSSVRKVTLMIHAEDIIYLAIDCDPTSIDARDAYWVEPKLNGNLKFEILAGQSVVGRASAELHELGVLIEYSGDDHG